MIPSLARSFEKVVATETLSTTASTATPVRRFCSLSEMPAAKGFEQFRVHFIQLRAPFSASARHRR